MGLRALSLSSWVSAKPKFCFVRSLAHSNKLLIAITGTTSIVDEVTYQPLLSILSAVVEVVVQLLRQGHKVVIVSSAAIAVGMKRMRIPDRPKSLSGKQVSPFLSVYLHVSGRVYLFLCFVGGIG